MKLSQLLEIDRKRPYDTQQYKFICELIWGGVPVDRDWVEESSIFKQEAPKILEKYPMLNKSFFENKTI
jgi:hypothetical protein